MPLSNPSITAAPPSTSGSSSAASQNAADILEQVGLLRDEVVRLRRLQDQGWNAVSEPPPEYS